MICILCDELVHGPEDDGFGLCGEHANLLGQGWVALIAIDESGKRAGSSALVRRDTAERVGMNLPDDELIFTCPPAMIFDLLMCARASELQTANSTLH